MPEKEYNNKKEAEEPETPLTEADEEKEIDILENEELVETDEEITANDTVEIEKHEAHTDEIITDTKDIENLEITTEEDNAISEEVEELEMLKIPLEEDLEEKQKEPLEEYSFEAATIEDDAEIEEYSFEPKKIKPVKKKKKMGLPFTISLLVGLALAILIEVLFSIPVWIGSSSRPDLFYIELVLMLIVITLPGLFTRSLQKGILGAFIIFSVSFALPLVLTLLGLHVILNPLAPIFASTDFALDAFYIFNALFPALGDLPFEQLQKWVWVVDLLFMFILAVVVVTFGTSLIKNITKQKKKVRTWIGIPLLSIGLIVFAIFTPIIFSSTYGVIQASTSFLAGTARMQQAFSIFEEGGVLPSTQAQEWLNNNLTDANFWLEISQRNYNGLRNIGIINIAILISGQYGPLIEAGDQLALATLALTGVLYPLFNGIYGLIQNLNTATQDLADFGQSSNPMPNYLRKGDYTTNDNSNLNELKASIEASIEGIESAEQALYIIQQQLAVAGIDGKFDEVKTTLDGINLEKFPKSISDIITQIKTNLVKFDGQLDGFQAFITFTSENLQPTKNILWTCYYNIAGNEYLKDNRFSDAKEAFYNATQHIDLIGSLSAYTPPSGLDKFFAMEVTAGYSALLEDLIEMMEPLLDEQLEYATTFDGITRIITYFASVDNISMVNYTNVQSPISSGNLAEFYGDLAQIKVNEFSNNINDNKYGTMFNDIGSNFQRILTDDFRPQAFGSLTKHLSEIVNYFVLSCEEYSLQNFANGIINIESANNIMNNNVLPILVIDDPNYLANYVYNWSAAIFSIKSIMESNNNIELYNIGLEQIKTAIINLLAKIEEK